MAIKQTYLKAWGLDVKDVFRSTYDVGYRRAIGQFEMGQLGGAITGCTHEDRTRAGTHGTVEVDGV